MIAPECTKQMYRVSDAPASKIEIFLITIFGILFYGWCFGICCQIIGAASTKLF